MKMSPNMLERHDGRSSFSVVRFSGGQLSAWPQDRLLPAGWEPAGHTGSLTDCLAEIDRISAPLARPGGGCADSATCPHRDTLLSLLSGAVRAHGDRPAVSEPNRSLTYRDLDRASDTIASGLRRRGLRREDRVAVYLPRGVDVFVALAGIIKAGGAYVPIDTRYPATRRDLMISASEAALVITAPALVTDLDAIATPVATTDELSAAGAGEAPSAVVSGCQAACVLFTSGSSGVPKAIVLEHRNLAYFSVNPALPRLRPDDRVAHVSSLSFDAFNFEAWCSLAAGAEIVVLPTMSDLVAGDLQRELRKRRITAMLAPTMAVNHIVAEDREAFSGLRILHTGGDVILSAACRDLLSGSFAGSFFNLYGPTEGTTACTAYHVASVAPGDDSVPIGTPLADALVYLLDEDLQPVPDGQAGELYIGGEGVARGYLGQPELTATRFLPDPFAAGGGRMYATGDLAMRRPDGLLHFLGRADDQVKIRGYRVEPREVERVLTRFERVRDVAVVVSGTGDGRHLVALVVADDGLSLRGLRAYARETLPDYLVPSVMTLVRRIPANDHGKRDMAELRELAHNELRRRRQAVEPCDDIERYLVDLWEELLAVEEVGVTDDFFALGGNSLLAFRLRRRVSSDLGTPVQMQEVLTATVLRDLADLLRERKVSLVP